jgi:hypothetical protein
MAVTVYDSKDSGAPELKLIAGSLVSVLKACLVTGYGAKSGAGWTVEIDTSANDKLFRNSATNGSGRYFRVKDDGLQQYGQSTPDYTTATITGAQNYTTISDLIVPFPRTITGTDRHNSTYYGCCIHKTFNQTGASKVFPWRIIADDSTCYLLISPFAADGSAITADTSTTDSLKLYAFGDFERLQNVSNHPRAFVGPNLFSASTATPDGHTIATSIGLGGYLEHCLESTSASTLYYVLPGISAASESHGANGLSATFGTYHLYPSPITGGAVLEDIFVCDDSNNIVRTNKHTNYITDRFAKFRGIKGCCNSLYPDASMKIGADWDVLQCDGRDYLLVRLTSNNSSPTKKGTYAIDLTGPW